MNLSADASRNNVWVPKVEKSLDMELVWLSVFLLCGTWYVFFAFMARIHATRKKIHLFWISNAALATGSGFFAVYMTGRLATGVPVSVNGHVFELLLAWMSCVAGLAGLALSLDRFKNRLLRPLLLLGVALALLMTHRIGMLGFGDQHILLPDVYSVWIFVKVLALAAGLHLLSRVESRHRMTVKAIMIPVIGVLWYLLLTRYQYVLFSAGKTDHPGLPVFDNISLGYVVGVVATVLLALSLISLFLSRKNALSARPTLGVRFGVVTLATLTLAVVATTRWLVETSLQKDLATYTSVVDVRNVINRANLEIGVMVAEQQPPQHFVGRVLQPLQQAGVRLQTLLNGGMVAGVLLPGAKDHHLRSDLENMLDTMQQWHQFLQHAAARERQQLLGRREYLQHERYAESMEVALGDVANDMHVLLAQDKKMMRWSHYMTLGLLLLLFVLIYQLLSRSWSAVAAKNDQLETLVKRRTRKLETAMQQIDRQMNDMVWTNARMEIITEALADLRADSDAQQQKEADEHQLAKNMLHHVLRVHGASGGLLWLLDKADDSQVLYAGQWWAEKGRLTQEQEAAWWAALEPLVSNEDEPRLLGAELGKRMGSRHLLWVPIYDHQHNLLMGMLLLGRENDKAASEDDVFFVSCLSAQLTDTLQQMHHISSLESRCQQLTRDNLEQQRLLLQATASSQQQA